MIALLTALLALQTTPAPTTVSAPASSPPASPPTAPSSATTRLVALRASFADVDCREVVEQAPFVFEHRLATPAERHEAGFMHAWCAVLDGNLATAEGLFSTIVGEDIAAEPPFPIEPRVRVLLEAARGEARKKLDAAAAAARAEAIGTIVFKVTPPAGVKGGARAFFAIEVEDPRRLVKGLRLEFRRKDDMGFYALPVTKLPDGTWRGEIPGTYTKSVTGQTIEWFIAAVDGEAEVLTSWGSRASPHRLEVSPGSSLAMDMKANERLTQDLRVGLAVVATPMLSTAGALAGAAMIVPAALGGPFVAWLAAATLPALGAVLGTSVVAAAILDPADATVAVFTTTLVATAFGLVVVAEGLANGYSLGPGDISDLARNSAIVVAGLGLVTTIVVPTALVVLDAPEE